MPFHHKMLHLIMSLLIHGAYMESTRCPEACSCIETLISGSSYKAVSLRDFDETAGQKGGLEGAQEEYEKYLGEGAAGESLQELSFLGGGRPNRFSRRKKCGEKGGGNVPSGPVEVSGEKGPRRRRAVTVRDGVNSSGAREGAAGGGGSGSGGGNEVFTYQITCVGLGDLRSVWIQYLPGPATELNIQRTNFQSFKAFQQILKESSSELSQLTVLSVSDSVINQSADKSYSVKTESTNKREAAGEGKRSEFLPFASLQNPRPRSKSEMKFPSDGKSRNLQVLNLTNSTIVYLPQDTFHPFINLQILNLSNNLLEFIENETFSSLANLLRLDVHSNRLRSLNEVMFRNLTKLVFLDVSRNLLSSIEPSTFQYLLSLNVLKLGSNPLSEKQEAVVLLGTGKRLQVVDISRAGLKQIPGTLERSVRVLNLMGNLLLSIRCGDLDSYSLLSYLNLRSNKISYVEDDAMGRLEFLKNLQISDNNLFQIPKILPNNLQILNLSFNNIQNLTNTDFLNLSSLKELSLSYNQISSIEESAFDNLLQLKVLDLSRNPLLVFPGIYARIRLVVLNLSYFTNIPESFGGRFKRFPVHSPQSVQQLNLESSPVLAKAFLQDTNTLQSFTSLEELNVRFTNLTTIRKDIFSLLPKLSVLRVEGNPWHCSREILTLSAWLRGHEAAGPTGDEDEVKTAHCLTPPHLYKANLVTLGEKDFDEGGGGVSGASVSAGKTEVISRDPEAPRNESEKGSTDVSDNELTTVKRVNAKTYVKTGGNVSLLLNDNKTGAPNRDNCCGNPEAKFPSSNNDSATAYVSPTERGSNQSVSTAPSTEGLISWGSTSSESPDGVKSSLDLKSRQVSLLALKKAEAVTSEETLSLKKEFNSHLSFLILSSIGLVVMATLTFTSLYFSRTRRDQSYQRQNQDIEVCSISSLRNELW